MMLRIALAASIAAAILMAQEPHPGLSVAGTVVSTGGDPVRKATVLLRARDEAGISYATESDGHGRFLVEDIQPGDYAVSADRQGFMLESDGARGAPPPTLKVEAGQSVKDVKIKLVPLGVVTGRVLDDDGDPVRGAQVEAMTYSYRAGKRLLARVEQVSATDKGEFRLFGLRPGTFYLRASGSNAGSRYFTMGPAISGTLPSGSYSSTYFPGTTDAAHAAPVEIAAGAQLRGLDIRLRREVHYSIRGRLPEQTHQGAQTMLEIVPRGGRDESFSFSARQDNDTFEFTDIPPGSYVVVAIILNDDKRSVARQPVEVVNADVEGFTLDFMPPMEVSGSVRVEGSPRLPLENLHVALQSETPAIVRPIRRRSEAGRKLCDYRCHSGRV
jgi:hypothetical protein